MKSVDQRKTFISSFETQPGIIKKDNEKRGGGGGLRSTSVYFTLINYSYAIVVL